MVFSPIGENRQFSEKRMGSGNYNK